MIDRIKKELFTAGTNLVHSDDATLYGAESYMNVYYFKHQYGYVIWLPVVRRGDNLIKLFEPINPTSFRWAMFNRQIIFVPTTEIPFKKIIKLHPQLKDYIVSFNLDYYTRFKKAFIESNNPQQEQFFLLRRPDNYVFDFDTLQDSVDLDTGYHNPINAAINNKKIETNKVITLSVIPEFLNSNSIVKIIREENIDDVWKHWLAAQYGDGLLDPQDRYYAKCNNNDDEWVDKVVAHLAIENLIETQKPTELDPDLKRLLGIKE